MWLPELRSQEDFWVELRGLFSSINRSEADPNSMDCGIESLNTEMPPISSTPLSLSESSSASPSVSSNITVATASSESNNVATSSSSPVELEASVASTPNPTETPELDSEPMEQ